MHVSKKVPHTDGFDVVFLREPLSCNMSEKIGIQCQIFVGFLMLDDALNSEVFLTYKLLHYTELRVINNNGYHDPSKSR